MLKKAALLAITASVFLLSDQQHLVAQCPGGYSQVQLNWDNLDYFYNSGGGAPYGTYITSTYEQTQRFSFGTTWLSIVTSSSAMITTTENATHTGELAGFAGDDVQYNPNANGQTITITFNEEVQNFSFTLYDIDGSARIDFNARNAANAAQSVSLATQASTILTRNNNNSTTAYFTSTASTLANSSNQGSGTVTVAGPVKSIVITVTSIGTDAVFWLSDINACASGSFPTSYHQSFDTRPFLAPVGLTADQPDYFIVTPDNNTAYMIDPATGNAWSLFTDASKSYMNSFTYDIENKILYYISENASLNLNNKELKKYDFNTEASSTVIANISTTLSIPTFNSGIESAAAAFYNGKLYLGIEGGSSTTTIRESIVWQIDLATNTASQVFATPSYNGAGLLHDWADFLVKDGELINFNSAQNADFANSSYTHFNLMTGVATKYSNPSPSTKYAGQAGMDWAGNYYSVYNVVQVYNGNGTIGASVPITVVSGPAWVANAGDASENFRPKADFGDAPASYDPDLRRPAVHERQENIILGAGWDREWVKKGVSGTDDTDDGLSYVPILGPGSVTSYMTQVSVNNNSGSNATLCAWLDYNGNGVFDAAEAITPITVPSSASAQDITLYWPSFSCSIPVGSFTYLRIRITSASAGMTGSHANGYFSNGEVEDYRVIVDNYPLSVKLLSFDLKSVDARAELNWKAIEEPGFAGYDIERSADASSWTRIMSIDGSPSAGTHSYKVKDPAALQGTYFYRLRLKNMDGTIKYSEVRSVRFYGEITVSVVPNPVRSRTTVKVFSKRATDAIITVTNEAGVIMFTSRRSLQAGPNQLELHAGDWPAANYFLHVQSGRELIHKKILVLR